jgi:hypothetical protein
MALPELLMRPRPRVLVVDVGGTHVKVLATGHRTPREIRSGPTMTAREMIAAVAIPPRPSPRSIPPERGRCTDRTGRAARSGAALTMTAA